MFLPKDWKLIEISLLVLISMKKINRASQVFPSVNIFYFNVLIWFSRITHLSSDRFAVVNLNKVYLCVIKKSVCKYKTNIFLLWHLRTTKNICASQKYLCVGPPQARCTPLKPAELFARWGGAGRGSCARKKFVCTPFFLFLVYQQ